MSPHVALRRLVEFNPPVPHSTRLTPKAAVRLLPMDSVGHFDTPKHGETRPVESLLQGYAYIEPSDVAYAKVTPCFENGKGLVGTDLIEPSFGSSELTVLRPNSLLDQRYLSYVLRSEAFRAHAVGSMTGAGGLKRVDEQEMRAYKVWAPPLSEQRAVADHLDREIAEIDAFIEDLDELRSLTSAHLDSSRNALARQPTANDDLKTDGHVVQLTRALPQRVDYRGATPRKTDLGVQLVTAGNVRSGWIDYTSPQDFVSHQEYEQIMRRGRPKKDDILFTMEAPLGNTALVDREDIALAQRIVKFRASPMVLPAFAMLAMSSAAFQSQLQALATGSTAIGLKASKLSQLYLRVPDLPEQETVIRQWSSVSSAALEIMASTGEARQLAIERRAAVISAAVTGEIDVTQRHKPVSEQLEEEVLQNV